MKKMALYWIAMMLFGTFCYAMGRMYGITSNLIFPFLSGFVSGSVGLWMGSSRV